MDPSPLVFSIPGYEHLAAEVVERTGFRRGSIFFERFPDGEPHYVIETDVTGERVVLIAGTVNDQSTLATLDIMQGLRSYGARSIRLALAYFGCARMDRSKDDKREIVTAKTRARLFSVGPQPPTGTWISVMEPHFYGNAHYFESPVEASPLFAKESLKSWIRNAGLSNLVLGSTDIGRAKLVSALASELGIGYSLIDKDRVAGDTTNARAVLGDDPNGMNVVMVDDMISTGGSAIGAGALFRQLGARDLYLVAVHGVLPGNAFDRLRSSGLFTKLVCSDSHPRAIELARQDPGFLEVFSVAPLIARWIRETAKLPEARA